MRMYFKVGEFRFSINVAYLLIFVFGVAVGLLLP